MTTRQMQRPRPRAASRTRGWLRGAVVPTGLACALLLLLASPPAAAQQPEPALLAHPMSVQYDVQVPTRDGVHLSADVYRPADAARHPAIFELTPYNNNAGDVMERAWHYVRQGYAFVPVDVRGRYDSEGKFDPWRTDGPDGSDVIDWIARQGWSDGHVATMGASYLGMDQWLVARENNPHHTALVSYVAPENGFRDVMRFDGVPKLDLIFTWAAGMYGHVNQSEAGWNWHAVMLGLPLTQLGERAGRPIPFWVDWMRHDREDAYWEPVSMSGHYGGFDKPSFNVTGWWDGQIIGTTSHFVNAERASGHPERSMLVIGPWLHGVNRTRKLGERDYGPHAIIDLQGLQDRWLGHVMLGAPDPGLARVMYFLPVKNVWKTAAGWPVPETRFTAYYLAGGGHANTLLGDGALSTREGAGRPDHFTYDPARPVPTVSSRTAGARGGIAQGSVDNRAVETRQDVLVYTSPALEEGMEATGPVEATIYFTTDVPDTDITVKLLDVYADGRALNLSHGIARARYRTSFAQPRLVTPGARDSVRVRMFPSSNYFEAGHRIRIEVSSSNFPLFGRNLNTADSPDTTSAMRVAHTTILHDARSPSRIVLPVIPAGATATTDVTDGGRR